VALDATALLGTRTGVAEFCLGALDALRRRRELEVSAFAVSWRRRNRLPAEVPAGVVVAQRSMPARPLQLAWRRSRHPAVEWFIGPIDVVHGTNFVVPPTRRAARVVTVNDLTPMRYPELCHRSSLVYPELVRRAIGEGAWVQTPSAFVATEVVEELGIDAARVRAIHYGIPARQGGNTAQPAVGRGGEAGCPPPITLPDGTHRYVLAVGTIEPRKDYPGLVAAFGQLAAEVPDVALVVAGGAGWGMPAFERALEACKWRDRIVCTGYLDRPSVFELLDRAAVLAFPSLYEGFGFPPLQAMEAGVPVVATRAGSVPEVVGDGARLVSPGDTEELAAALVAVLTDDAERARLVASGRRRAALFSWDRCAEGLSRLYQDASGR